jgi:pimeloyl-ACP methyl ester carboxylesterase
MGSGDIPANLDYITAKTKFEKVAYIGHSQGTTQLFYALATAEEYYQEKISIFVALGPVMNLAHCKSDLIDFVAWNSWWVVPTAELLGCYEWFPANWLTTGAMRLLCGTIPALCEFSASLVADEDPSLDDDTRFQDYMGHFPSGTSLRCLDHYGQIVNADQFRRYDYGSKKNNEIYG